MNEDHERAQELIAAHALDALDDEDAARAEELVTAHVPGCAECRSALDGFQALSGDLALAAGTRTPPRPLLARIRREISRPRVPWWTRGTAAAVAVLLVAAFGAWTASLSNRVTRAERRQASTTEVLATVSHPRSRVVSLSTGAGRPVAVSLAATYVPGRQTLYVFGSMPDPAGDRVYQIWLVRRAGYLSVGVFKPERGQVLVRLPVEAGAYRELLITEEPGAGSLRPSSRHVVQGQLG